jgi:heterotetrameric sarcosine oxidase gamma subunit
MPDSKDVIGAVPSQLWLLAHPTAGVHLTPRSGLEGLADPGRHGATAGKPGVWIRRRADLALVTVMARKTAQEPLIRRVRDLYALDLPAKPRRVAAGPYAFVWAGAQRWLATAEGEDGHGFAARLRHELAGLASVVDQSDGFAVIRIGGPKARSALAKGVPVDLYPRVFAAGDVAVTAAAHIGVHLWQLDDAPAYDVAVFRSYAAAFWRWLVDSAAEFGVVVEDGG